MVYTGGKRLPQGQRIIIQAPFITHSAYIDNDTDIYSNEMDELFEIEAEDRKREAWFFQY